MASRLTTITRHQEIAGSTPVSVNMTLARYMYFLDLNDRPTFIIPRRGGIQQSGTPDTLKQTRKVNSVMRLDTEKH